MELIPNMEDDKVIEFQVTTAYKHPESTLWVVSDYESRHENDLERIYSSMEATHLSIRRTCLSAIFQGLRIDWFDTEVHEEKQVNWTRTDISWAHRISIYGKGFELKPQENEEGIYTVRIALWLLVDMIAAGVLPAEGDARLESPWARTVAPPRILRASNALD
jgi:hypothetical protein